MIDAINHITLSTNDLDRSFEFYKTILGFKPLCKWHAGAYFLIGETTWFCLSYDETHIPSSGYTHIAFNVNAQEFKIMKQAITASNATIFKQNISEGESLYFLDPVGHKLEIHVGDWMSRIKTKRESAGSWREVEFFV